MCRVLGCVAAEPVALRHELLDAASPLIRPDHEDDSGWGMAVYPRAEGEDPRCMRFPRRPGGDAEVGAAADQRGRLINAHARRATTGPAIPENTHPFCMGPYSFCHNGTILDFTRLYEPRLPRPSGDTDSEHLFNLVLHHLDSADAIDGLRYAMQATISRWAFSSLNFLFSDGERLYAYRLGLCELHWAARPGQLLVASEPATDTDTWHSVKQDVLLVLDPSDPESPHAERLVGDDLLARADIRDLDGRGEPAGRLAPTQSE